MVSSKYKYLQVGVVIFFALLFIFIPVIILKHKAVLSSKDAFGILLLLFFATYLPFSFFSHSPKIILDTDSIVIKSFFKTTRYSWQDVAKVHLRSMEFYSVFFILGHNFPAMKLVFNDGKSLVFWEDVYRNMNEMREVIAEKLNDKIHFMKKADERVISNFIVDKKYAGNPFTSLNTLLIAGIIIFSWLNFQQKSVGIKVTKD